MNDAEFMQEAIAEAQIALEEGETPVGCVIARKGEIVARAHNRREALHDPTAHAEILAIRIAAKNVNDWRLNDCTLYVTLEPCPMCAGAISQARIGRLLYGARDEKQGCAGSVYRIPEDPVFPHFCPSDGGLLEAECRAPLIEFFKYKRIRNA
ncbi:MAG: tRNA adenosine(34) deaminase TadA [Clostridia bacterium]|nr:tRNA adenosine(34) deaminase TadA [Clostridia bacterium]